jgi:hypothetical protein
MEIRGAFTINSGATYTPWSNTHNFAGSSNQVISGAGTLNSFGGNFNVASGATVTLQKDITINGTLNINETLNTGTSTVSGSGTVNLPASGTLGIGSPDGITASSANGNIQTTTRSFDGDATYHYNGTTGQDTGDGLPSGVDHLIIDNSAGVTLTNAATVTTTLTLSNGLFTNGSNLTLDAGATIDRETGSLNTAPTFGTSVNVIYSGSTGVTTGYEIPTSSSVLNNLTVSNSGGVTLTNVITASGNLNINSDALLDLAAYTITVDTAVTNNGTLVQQRTVNNANVEFMHIQDSTGSTTQYRGVEIDTSADSNNLGVVIVRLRDNAGMTCTTTGGSSPAYAPRCFDITPTNNLSATVTVWTPTSVLPGAVTTPRVFHWNGTSWDQLTNGSSGTNGSYTYARGNTSGFSAFLLAQDGAAPTAISLQRLNATNPLPVGLLVTLSVMLLLILGFTYIRQSRNSS